MEGYFLYIANKLGEIRSGQESGGPKGLFLRELKQWAFWRAVIAELIGTMLFVLIGCASTIQFTVEGSLFQYDGLDPARIVRIGLAFGIMIAVMINCVGHVSGGHFNPAVSIGMAVAMNISPLRAVLYTVGQCVGAILGVLILKGLTPSVFHSNLGVTSVNPSLDAGQGFGCECVFTFILVLCIFGITDSDRSIFGNPAFGIGFTVSVLHFAGIPFTGASMNPARSLGTAVVSDSWDDFWVYWVGPVLGGCVAALSYKFIFNPYRGNMPMSEAVDKLVADGDVIVIPKAYFTAGAPQSGKANTEMTSSPM